MFDQFTDPARRVIIFGQEEAQGLDHDYIGTEHLLLGLIREGDGIGAKTLQWQNISLDAARQQVEEIVGRGQHPANGHMPFTPRAKKVLDASLRESILAGREFCDTQHVLLALVREGDGVGVQVLVRLGADLKRIEDLLVGDDSAG